MTKYQKNGRILRSNKAIVKISDFAITIDHSKDCNDHKIENMVKLGGKRY